jgi:membrane fusion protein (multidrug efflux system)
MTRKILCVLPLFLLAACHPKTKQEQLADLLKQQKDIATSIAKLQSEIGVKADSSKVTNVAVATVDTTLFENYIQIQGRVDADEDVNVVPEAQGVVTNTYVTLGQHVNQGQVLAKLDDRVIEQSMAQLQSQLDYFQNLYDRQQKLWNENIGTQVQLLTAKNNVENAQRQIAVQKSQEDMYLIKAPVSGTVDQFDVRLGQMISPTSIRVVNTDNLKVKGQVGETYVDKVHKGDPVTLIFPDASDTLHTRLDYVGKVIDPSSRSFDIEIQLHGREAQFKPNMVAVIKIVSYENKHAIVVPINPVQIAQDGDYVFIADNGVAKKKKIILGQTYNGTAEVTSGLMPGDQLIVTGYQDLDDGDRIRY